MRRSLIAVVVAMIGVLAITVAPAVRADDNPIKIGFLAPLTGPFADVGKDMVEGVQLALKSLGGKIAGRPVELLIQDTAGDPDTGLSKARLLVEQSKVDLLTGVYHGGVAMAVAFYAKQKKFPLVITGGRRRGRRDVSDKTAALCLPCLAFDHSDAQGARLLHSIRDGQA